MELSIKLARVRGNTLPVNYQYAVSSWIYKVIGRADGEYSAFLHEKGFAFNGRKFKMFTFSQLDLRPYKVAGNEFRLLGSEISLNVRFLVDSSMENFIRGLFMHQHCGLGNGYAQTDFQVIAVEAKQPPLLNTTMRYECLSPIVVSTLRDDRSVAYVSPEDPAFSRVFHGNLVRKHSALALHAGGPEPEPPRGNFSFRLLNEPRKKGTTIKEHTAEETKVIAYLFRFELTAPVELHEVGYYAGFGEKNAMGFGCVRVMDGTIDK